jgi:hypothetical protein
MILSFEDELGKRHFEYCFVGFVLGGSLLDKKGLSVLRRELVLFEKLESISDLKPCGKKMVNNEPERQLKTDGTPLVLTIDDPEIDMLYSYVGLVPWQSGTSTRNALECIDWLARVSKGV